MAASSERSFFRHPMAKFALVVFALFALWFGGWFAFASYADGKLAEAVENVDQRGIRIDCENRSIRGFPFRIGVHCDSLSVAHKRDVFRFELGSIRTAAQLYAPGELVAEIEAPFKTWPNGVELNADWSFLRLFLDANLTGGFELASLNIGDFKTTLKTIAINVAKGALHFRPTPVEGETESPVSLDGALSLDSLTANLPSLVIPEASFQADGTLEDGYRDLVLQGRPFRAVMKDGAVFDIRNIALSLPDGGKLAFSGPLELDEEGLLTGKISVGVANPQSLSDWAGKIDQRLAQQIGFITQAVAGMGKPKRFGNDDLQSIVVTITKGEVSLGFLKMPEPIPPLFRN